MEDYRGVPEIPKNAMHATLEEYKGCKILILYCGTNYFYKIEDARAELEALIIESPAIAYPSQDSALEAARREVDKIVLRDRIIELGDCLMRSQPDSNAIGRLYVEFLDRVNDLASFDNPSP